LLKLQHRAARLTNESAQVPSGDTGFGRTCRGKVDAGRHSRMEVSGTEFHLPPMCLLDVNMPKKVASLLGEFGIKADSADDRGWGGLTNGGW
jgi:hypothetical protein